MTPRVTLVGVAATLRRFADLKGRALEELRNTTVSLVIKLQRKVKEEKLSGQVLKNRTGRLRRSITGKTEGEGTQLYGIVGTNVEYAAVHEYGGPVTIKAHLRTITQAFGKTLRQPVTFSVRAHTVNYKQRSFLRSALIEMSAEIKQELTQAMRKAMK